MVTGGHRDGRVMYSNRRRSCDIFEPVKLAVEPIDRRARPYLSVSRYGKSNGLNRRCGVPLTPDSTDHDRRSDRHEGDEDVPRPSSQREFRAEPAYRRPFDDVASIYSKYSRIARRPQARNPAGVTARDAGGARLGQARVAATFIV